MLSLFLRIGKILNIFRKFVNFQSTFHCVHHLQDVFAYTIAVFFSWLKIYLFIIFYFVMVFVNYFIAFFFQSTSILKKEYEMSCLQKEVKDKEFQCCRLVS